MAVVLLLAVLGCSGGEDRPAAESGDFDPSSTRGYILISLDTLRADRLGAYGHHRDTTPFLDSLAGRATLFERAYAQYPATLVSHISIFTGLYPQQHGVFPPSAVLAPGIETLPQRFLAAGFRTSGHTEGGFVAGGYGFNRGFEEFTDTPHTSDTDVERTFERGLDFLRRLDREERFFLFLHTYSTHDPYEPPEPYRSMFLSDSEPDAFPSTGENLRRVNRSELPADEETIEHFRDRYDGSVRYVDTVLERFFAGLEELGLLDQTTVILTSDHGEEFLEHGKLAHEQLYPECLHVPLILIHPGQRSGARIADPVESIDLAPTLYELAGIEPRADLAGRSLVPYLRRPVSSGPSAAFGEVSDRVVERTLIEEVEGEVYQLLVSRPAFDGEGTWITRTLTFDSRSPEVDFRAVSFHRPRTLEIRVDGVHHDSIELPTERISISLRLPAGESGYRITLSAEGCDSPRDLGLGDDGRCLSFELRDLPFRRLELYNLSRDPEARRDLSRREPAALRRLARSLENYRWQLLEAPGDQPLDGQTRETLEALGYLE